MLLSRGLVMWWVRLTTHLEKRLTIQWVISAARAEQPYRLVKLLLTVGDVSGGKNIFKGSQRGFGEVSLKDDAND